MWAGGRGEQLRLPREDRWQRRSDGWTQQEKRRKEVGRLKKLTRQMLRLTTHHDSTWPTRRHTSSLMRRPLFSTCVSPAAAQRSDTSHFPSRLHDFLSLSLTHTHTHTHTHTKDYFQHQFQHLMSSVKDVPFSCRQVSNKYLTSYRIRTSASQNVSKYSFTQNLHSNGREVV